MRCLSFFMEDVRPSMRGNSRHSTIDCQGVANRGGKSIGFDECFGDHVRLEVFALSAADKRESVHGQYFIELFRIR